MVSYSGGIKFNVIKKCLEYELRNWAEQTGKRLLGRRRHKFDVKHRYPVWAAKKIVIEENLALSGDRLSWFYGAFDRNDADPLTNYALGYIEKNVPKDASILVMGCGAGIMSFHLADVGFKNIEGRDLMDKCIRVANRLKNKYHYHETKFCVDDGFNPKLDSTYDVITAMHWIFSAWMGNYGNNPVDDPFNPLLREKLLTELLSKYSAHLNAGGFMVIELIDAVADYRDPYDHPLGEESLKIYPVRHTPQQVAESAEKVGLTVVSKRLCVNYSHQPRTSYILQKRKLIG